MSHPSTSHSPIITLFKRFYADLTRQEWSELERFYAPDICFRDPVHKLKGVEALRAYLEALCGNLTGCRFDYLDENVQDGTAYIKWDMTYSHPRVRGGAPVTVRGMSQLEFDSRGIYYHEDVYDMGAMLYEHVPILGTGVRWLRHRLGNAAP